MVDVSRFVFRPPSRDTIDIDSYLESDEYIRWSDVGSQQSQHYITQEERYIPMMSRDTAPISIPFVHIKPSPDLNVNSEGRQDTSDVCFVLLHANAEDMFTSLKLARRICFQTDVIPVSSVCSLHPRVQRILSSRQLRERRDSYQTRYGVFHAYDPRHVPHPLPPHRYNRSLTVK